MANPTVKGYLNKAPFEIYFNEFDECYHVLEHLGLFETESKTTGELIEYSRVKVIGKADRFAEAKKILNKYKKGGKDNE